LMRGGEGEGEDEVEVEVEVEVEKVLTLEKKKVIHKIQSTCQTGNSG